MTTTSTDDFVFVRIGSHRAGDRLQQLLAVERLDWHYTWADGGVFARIPAGRLDEARAIPSITRAARPRDAFHRCIDMSS